MNLGPVLDAALEAQAVCQKLGLPSCVIGGVALQRWGEPRFTADADLSVLVEPGDEERVAGALLEEMTPRIEDAAAFAHRTRVLLMRSDQGVGIDIVLAGLTSGSTYKPGPPPFFPTNQRRWRVCPSTPSQAILRP